MTEAQVKQFHVRLLEVVALVEAATLAHQEVNQEWTAAQARAAALDFLDTERNRQRREARELLLKLINARQFTDDGLPADMSLEEWQRRVNPEAGGDG